MSDATQVTRPDGASRRRLRQELRVIENRLRRGGRSRRNKVRAADLSLSAQDARAEHVAGLTARAAEIRRVLEVGGVTGATVPDVSA